MEKRIINSCWNQTRYWIAVESFIMNGPSYQHLSILVTCAHTRTRAHVHTHTLMHTQWNAVCLLTDTMGIIQRHLHLWMTWAKTMNPSRTGLEAPRPISRTQPHTEQHPENTTEKQPANFRIETFFRTKAGFLQQIDDMRTHKGRNRTDTLRLDRCLDQMLHGGHIKNPNLNRRKVPE